MSVIPVSYLKERDTQMLGHQGVECREGGPYKGSLLSVKGQEQLMLEPHIRLLSMVDLPYPKP